MDPPGFALESFDVMGGWRDHYRGIAEDKPAEKGIGKNGHPFEFYFGLPVDSAGELPDGRRFPTFAISNALSVKMMRCWPAISRGNWSFTQPARR